MHNQCKYIRDRPVMGFPICFISSSDGYVVLHSSVVCFPTGGEVWSNGSSKACTFVGDAMMPRNTLDPGLIQI